MAVSTSPAGVLGRSRDHRLRRRCARSTAAPVGDRCATLGASLTNDFVVGARSTHDDLSDGQR